MKRRTYIFFAILFVAVAQMKAQQIAVEFNDGGEVKFEECYTHSKVTFSNGQMMFHVDGAVESTIDIKDVNRIYFYGSNAHIGEVLDKEPMVYSADAEALLVHTNPGTAVAIYHANGSLILSRVQTIASTPISVAHLPAGAYIAVVENVTLKFVKQ